jgi:hypothetical protein
MRHPVLGRASAATGGVGSSMRNSVHARRLAGSVRQHGHARRSPACSAIHEHYPVGRHAIIRKYLQKACDSNSQLHSCECCAETPKLAGRQGLRAAACGRLERAAQGLNGGTGCCRLIQSPSSALARSEARTVRPSTASSRWTSGYVDKKRHQIGAMTCSSARSPWFIPEFPSIGNAKDMAFSFCAIRPHFSARSGFEEALKRLLCRA